MTYQFNDIAYVGPVKKTGNHGREEDGPTQTMKVRLAVQTFVVLMQDV